MFGSKVGNGKLLDHSAVETKRVVVKGQLLFAVQVKIDLSPHPNILYKRKDIDYLDNNKHS